MLLVRDILVDGEKTFVNIYFIKLCSMSNLHIKKKNKQKTVSFLNFFLPFLGKRKNDICSTNVMLP